MNYQFIDTQNLFVECDLLHESKFDGDSKAIGHFHQHLSPQDHHLNRMHKAQVHALSDSILCLAPDAQHDALSTWNFQNGSRRKCAYQDISHKMNGQYVDFVLHVFSGVLLTKIRQEVMDLVVET